MLSLIGQAQRARRQAGNIGVFAELALGALKAREEPGRGERAAQPPVEAGGTTGPGTSWAIISFQPSGRFCQSRM